MGVQAGARRDPQGVAQLFGQSVDLRLGAAVEDFHNNVDLAQKETDQITFRRKNVLTDEGGLSRLNQPAGAVNTVMVREEEGARPYLAAAAGHLERRHPAIKGGRAV